LQRHWEKDFRGSVRGKRVGRHALLLKRDNSSTVKGFVGMELRRRGKRLRKRGGKGRFDDFRSARNALQFNWGSSKNKKKKKKIGPLNRVTRVFMKST